jgi:hypothetical protein
MSGEWLQKGLFPAIVPGVFPSLLPKSDLAPVAVPGCFYQRFSGVNVQFIEPPLNGRALPGEVAHAARAVVRGLVLAMMEQPEVRRIRAQRDCDGENLLINVRDDGQGALSSDATTIGRLERRVQALSGNMQIDVMQGSGAVVSVTLPLDAPTGPTGDVAGWNLATRELEVLQHLAAGQRNRSSHRRLASAKTQSSSTCVTSLKSSVSARGQKPLPWHTATEFADQQPPRGRSPLGCARRRNRPVDIQRAPPIRPAARMLLGRRTRRPAATRPRPVRASAS